MKSAASLMRRRAKAKATLSVAATALLNDIREESQAHEDIDAFYAPSECHSLVKPHDPVAVLASLGRTLKWFTRECRKRGVSNRWLHYHGLPTYREKASIGSFDDRLSLPR